MPGAILKGGQDTTRARKSPENKCEGFLHGSLSRVGKITLPIHPDNPHLTTFTQHVMVGITRSKVILIFIPIWGNDPICNIFRRGWFNHQLVIHESIPGLHQEDSRVQIAAVRYKVRRIRSRSRGPEIGWTSPKMVMNYQSRNMGM